MQVECHACKALLTVKDTGTYKCPRCMTPFNYTGGGRASFLPRNKSLPAQLSLNFSPECTDGLMEFVSRFSAKSGFSAEGISEVQSTVKDTVEIICRTAYAGNVENLYHVLLVSVDSQLEIRFADFGKSVANDGNGPFSSIRRAVDKFEHKHHPKGGNIVTVVKKAK